jgi:heme A synthase
MILALDRVILRAPGGDRRAAHYVRHDRLDRSNARGFVVKRLLVAVTVTMAVSGAMVATAEAAHAQVPCPPTMWLQCAQQQATTAQNEQTAAANAYQSALTGFGSPTR